MIQKLKQERYYYLYLDRKNNIYISDIEPVKASNESISMYHPDFGYKCFQSVYVGKPESSADIKKFYNA